VEGLVAKRAHNGRLFQLLNSLGKKTLLDCASVGIEAKRSLQLGLRQRAEQSDDHFNAAVRPVTDS
jgi:hypothetical protein